MLRIVLHIVLFIVAAIAAGWLIVRLMQPGNDIVQAMFMVGGLWLALAGVLLAMVNIGRAEL